MDIKVGTIGSTELGRWREGKTSHVYLRFSLINQRWVLSYAEDVDTVVIKNFEQYAFTELSHVSDQPVLLVRLRWVKLHYHSTHPENTNRAKSFVWWPQAWSCIELQAAGGDNRIGTGDRKLPTVCAEGVRGVRPVDCLSPDFSYRRFIQIFHIPASSLNKHRLYSWDVHLSDYHFFIESGPH